MVVRKNIFLAPVQDLFSSALELIRLIILTDGVHNVNLNSLGLDFWILWESLAVGIKAHLIVAAAGRGSYEPHQEEKTKFSFHCGFNVGASTITDDNFTELTVF